MRSVSRRGLLIGSAASLAAPAWLTPALAQSTTPSAKRTPTPSQTEGPFYPVSLPADSDADLLRNGQARYSVGQPAWVDGTVVDLAGVPVQGAVVEIWQCDAAGHYHHPGDGGRADPAFQGFGRVVVDREGRYRFRTIRPVQYGGRTPHIHVKVRLDRMELLTTQLYVQGDPGNERDFLWRRLSEPARAAITVPFVSSSDGIRATFPIVVQA
ncbi:MAG: protocatechuate 3,4-dioxygenase [Hydrogenophaga sp.]|jgi:protocatechuate 3,4-dioxygenase beta subunit|nr:protocatechuate 3,4-dioxygenase [Hydrogenophaga sp.]